jgi:hypothetical protein
MRSARILTLAIAGPLLASCTAFNAAGVRPPDLSAEVRAPCPHPSKFIGAGDWELIAGRLGDALIECGAEKAIAIASSDLVADALR